MDDSRRPQNQQSQACDGTINHTPGQPLLHELGPGEIVGGRYKVISVLGRGGNGTVYEVEQVFLKQKLALKTMNATASTEVAAVRFQKEAQAAYKLNHPNLVRAVDFGITEENEPFLAMELVHGKSLREYLHSHTRLTPAEALDIFVPACEAFAYAHDNGIIHRDIKPANILLLESADGKKLIPKIVDFGIAKFELGNEEQGLTRTGEIFGTPLYMSPEQCSGVLVDKRSDIYSLACVLYEALTGGAPFVGKTAVETITQHISTKPLTLKEASLGQDYPPGWQEVISKALEKDPNDRYQSFSQLGDDLQLLKAGQRPRLGALAIAQPKRSLKLPLALGLSLAVAIGFIFAIWIANDRRGQSPRKKDSSLAEFASFGPKDPLKQNSTPGAIEETSRSTEEPSNKRLLAPAVPEQISKIEGEGANARRVFDFGKDLYGAVLVDGTTSSARIPARGKFAIPADKRITIMIDWPVFLAHPNRMREFGADYVKALNMRTNDNIVFFNENENSDLDYALVYAQHLTEIELLDLHNCPVTMRGLDNLKLSKFTKLHQLNIGKTRIDPAAFKETYKDLLKNLNELDFIEVPNAKSVLTVLRNSQAMRSLSLAGDQMTDADVETICTMPNLYNIDLNGNAGVTDLSVSYLAKLKHLELLNLSDTKVTHKSLSLLKTMKSLTMLRLPANTWTYQDKQELIKALGDRCKPEFNGPRTQSFDIN